MFVWCLRRKLLIDDQDTHMCFRCQSAPNFLPVHRPAMHQSSWAAWLGGTSIQLDSIQFNWRGGIGAKVRCWSWRRPYFLIQRWLCDWSPDCKVFCILVSGERGQKVENPLLDIVQEIPFGWGWIKLLECLVDEEATLSIVFVQTDLASNYRSQI